jgi:hypothetical protein
VLNSFDHRWSLRIQRVAQHRGGMGDRFRFSGDAVSHRRRPRL